LSDGWWFWIFFNVSFVYFIWRNSYAKLGCLSFCCLVRVLCLFWVLASQQIHDLQILPPFCRLSSFPLSLPPSVVLGFEFRAYTLNHSGSLYFLWWVISSWVSWTICLAVFEPWPSWSLPPRITDVKHWCSVLFHFLDSVLRCF
jgi:hypothetical protein